MTKFVKSIKNKVSRVNALVKKDKTHVISKIRGIFVKKIKGKKASEAVSSKRGKNHAWKGHWLEKQFSLRPNANNSPDLMGYELKCKTASAHRITFGDWRPDEIFFQPGEIIRAFNGQSSSISQDQFIRWFGQYNPLKKRHGWSGSHVIPVKPDVYSPSGSIFVLDEDNNIYLFYNYTEDTRPWSHKKNIPLYIRKKPFILLAFWKKEKIAALVNRKFNQRGFVICHQNTKGIFHAISFGKPLDFDQWIALFKEGAIFLDSGMYQGNSRFYCTWRAHEKIWDMLLEKTFY